MGNCGSSFDQAYCQEHLNQPLSADPDIVGPGVLAAFGLTALVTFGAIVFGYLTDSVPCEYLNSVDIVLLDKLQKSLAAKSLRKVSKLWHILTAAFWRCLHIEPPAEKRKSMSRAQREKILEKFVLTLSDQQLVTGTAILVAAFVNHCKISIYEWNVVVSLAWFSAVTHLSTLDILQRYFRQNRVVRNWRIAGMIGFLGLLIAAEIITLLYEPSDVPLPLECFAGPNLGPYTSYTDDPLFIITTIVATAFIICYLIAGYTSRIGNLFTEPPIVRNGPRLFWTILLKVRSKNTDAKQRRDIITRAYSAYEISKTSSRRGLIHSLPHLYGKSLMIRLASLVFFLAFGICQVVTYRWFDGTPNLADDVNTMDFGQIVPLILLLLPILSAAEIFYDEEEDGAEDSASPDELSPETRLVERYAYRVGGIFLVHVAIAIFIAIALSIPVNDESPFGLITLIILGAVGMGIYAIITVFNTMRETYAIRHFIQHARSNHLRALTTGNNTSALTQGAQQSQSGMTGDASKANGTRGFTVHQPK